MDPARRNEMMLPDDIAEILEQDAILWEWEPFPADCGDGRSGAMHPSDRDGYSAQAPVTRADFHHDGTVRDHHQET